MSKQTSLRYTWLDLFIEHGPQCPYQRALGFALSYHMDDDGFCYPGHRRLAQVSGMSRPSVIKFLNQLCKSGWIEITKNAKSTKGGNVNCYQAVNPIDHLGAESGKQGLPLNDEKDGKRSTPFTTSKPEAVNGETFSSKRQHSKRSTPFTKTTRTTKHKQQDLPGWVNVDSWNEFEQHRKDIKKPLSELAARKNLKILAQHKDRQQEIIDATIANGWTGLFSPKPESTTPTAAEITSRYSI